MLLSEASGASTDLNEPHAVGEFTSSLPRDVAELRSGMMTFFGHNKQKYTKNKFIATYCDDFLASHPDLGCDNHGLGQGIATLRT